MGLISGEERCRLLYWYNKPCSTPRKNVKVKFLNSGVINHSIVKNTYICAHYNCADLPMLSDFEELKTRLSIVNKSFVTLGKPLNFNDTFVYIRDTMLLAPAGKGSLEALGSLYEAEGGFTKKMISNEDKNRMDEFLVKDKKGFEEYAIQDAVVTLKHAIAMEKFNMGIKKFGIPVTLSSIGRNYVFNEWNTIFPKHMPYQISGDSLMGNADDLQTPKGLFQTGDVGLHMSYYIGNYKGGRNESFMYGSEDNTH